MDIVTSLFQIIVPGALVLVAIYTTVNAFLKKDFDKQLLEMRTRNSQTVMPIRLQAYERIALLLERLAPHNLVRRANNPGFNVVQFQQVLLQEVREEYNHNLSQQIYISDEAWTLTKNAIEEITSLINTSAQRVNSDGPSIELARAIFETMIERNEDPTERALRVLKDELRIMF